MSEANVESRIQSLLQVTSVFNNAGVTIGDYRVLDSSETNIAVIIPGPFSTKYERGRPGDVVGIPPAGVEVVWTEYIDLFTRMAINLATTWTNFRDLRQTVIDTILSNPSLNDESLPITGTDVTFARFGDAREDPEYWYNKNGGLEFIKQRLSVEVGEFHVQTSGEYA